VERLALLVYLSRMRFPMSRLMAVAACALLASFSAGCGPTPSKVCGKLAELDALPVGGPTGCEIKWDKARKDDAEKYKKDAECVLAATKKEDLSKCK
jgi:hypothetical protein